MFLVKQKKNQQQKLSISLMFFSHEKGCTLPPPPSHQLLGEHQSFIGTYDCEDMEYEDFIGMKKQKQKKVIGKKCGSYAEIDHAICFITPVSLTIGLTIAS